MPKIAKHLGAAQYELEPGAIVEALTKMAKGR
jgi:hypothetical protein